MKGEIRKRRRDKDRKKEKTSKRASAIEEREIMKDKNEKKRAYTIPVPSLCKCHTSTLVMSHTSHFDRTSEPNSR